MRWEPAPAYASLFVRALLGRSYLRSSDPRPSLPPDFYAGQCSSSALVVRFGRKNGMYLYLALGASGLFFCRPRRFDRGASLVSSPRFRGGLPLGSFPPRPLWDDVDHAREIYSAVEERALLRRGHGAVSVGCDP